MSQVGFFIFFLVLLSMLRFPFYYYAANIANFCENSYFCVTFMVAACERSL